MCQALIPSHKYRKNAMFWNSSPRVGVGAADDRRFTFARMQILDGYRTQNINIQNQDSLRCLLTLIKGDET